MSKWQRYPARVSQSKLKLQARLIEGMSCEKEEAAYEAIIERHDCVVVELGLLEHV